MSATIHAFLCRDGREKGVCGVRKGIINAYDSLFLGVNHYGLADGIRKEVLPPLYDKIGNPGLTVADCMESFLKVGLPHQK